MPVYEFVCMECEGHFEELLRMADGDPTCPSCGGARVTRQFSVFAAGSSTSRESSITGTSGGCACGGACSCGH